MRNIVIIISQDHPTIRLDSLDVIKVNYAVRAGVDGAPGEGGTGGGLTEVRNENIVGAIQSDLFISSGGTQGWKIDKDGGVIFNEGVFKGAVYFKKADGSLQSMSTMEFGKTYTWIKYASNADGTSGFGNDPTDALYMGIAYNKPTPIESVDPADYTWALFRGTDGINGTGIVLKGAVATVGNLPGTDRTVGDIWLIQADSHGYVWTGSVWTDIGPMVGPQGIPGIPGANGVPTYTWIMYSDHEDGTDLYNIPTESTLYIGIAPNQLTIIESTDKNDYLWSRFKGDQGIAGATLYTWLKYADKPVGEDVNPSTGISDDPTGKYYMGIAYNKESSTESTNYADYNWTPIAAEDGLVGQPGADGQTLYTWIRYANDASGNGMSQQPIGKTYIGIAYNKNTPIESNTASDYTWALIQGPQGAPGTNGINGINGQDLAISYWARENNITFIDGRKIYTGDAFVDTLVIADHAVSYPIVAIMAPGTTFSANQGQTISTLIPLGAIPAKFPMVSIVSNICLLVYFGTSQVSINPNTGIEVHPNSIKIELLAEGGVIQTLVDTDKVLLFGKKFPSSSIYYTAADNLAKVFYHQKGNGVVNYSLRITCNAAMNPWTILDISGTGVNILGVAK